MAFRRIQAETVKFQGFDGDSGDAYYARPSAAGKYPGVVVIRARGGAAPVSSHQFLATDRPRYDKKPHTTARGCQNTRDCLASGARKFRRAALQQRCDAFLVVRFFHELADQPLGVFYRLTDVGAEQFTVELPLCDRCRCG